MDRTINIHTQPDQLSLEYELNRVDLETELLPHSPFTPEFADEGAGCHGVNGLVRRVRFRAGAGGTAGTQRIGECHIEGALQDCVHDTWTQLDKQNREDV